MPQKFANPPPSHPLSRCVLLLQWWSLGLVAIALAVGWTAFGANYYQRVLPFFDSLSYQESFVTIVQRTADVGPLKALIEVWHEPSNVVLFKFFAAAFGRFLPASNEGLYLYLFGIHFIGVAALIGATRGSSGTLTLGIYAAAAWLASRPFSETVNGVLDQRMDLASASFCLAVAALFFDWAKRPTRARAFLAGLAAALAILHRPVMAVTITGIATIFFGRALLRHRTRRNAWWSEGGLILLPGLLLTLPWLIYHAQDLKFYYLIWNVAVGNATSMSEAAAYNLEMFGWATGTIYPIMVGLVLAWAIIRRRIDWLDLGAVVLCLALPLVLLIGSRSVGNFLVCQVALGMPALALASVRPAENAPTRTSVLTAGISAVVLLGVAGRSLHDLGPQVASVSRTPRAETVKALREIDAAAAASNRVMTGFQTFPLDTLGMVAIARQEGINLRAGRSFFHPVDFGISNAAATTISDKELQSVVTQRLRELRGNSTLLLIAAAESESLLPPAHYSQIHSRVIRAAVEADPGLTRVCTTSPIQGIRFDVYTIALRR